ncbi:hypothetical protein NC651_024105 [Populus alba x Populus x berolinensis]|nr:hypothetical protein NC651_024105 [Populus alba x Populus x berolinensis]
MDIKGLVINYSKLNSLRTCIGNFTDGKMTKANGGNHSHHKFCNSAICIDNDPAKQGSNEAFQFSGLQTRESVHLIASNVTHNQFSD